MWGRNREKKEIRNRDREEKGERTERFSGTKEKEESKKYKYGGKKGEGNNQQVGVSLW